jgi:hypothetical protein
MTSLFQLLLHTLSQMVRHLKLIVGCLTGLAVHFSPDLILVFKDILEARLPITGLVVKLEYTRLSDCFLLFVTILFIPVH